MSVNVPTSVDHSSLEARVATLEANTPADHSAQIALLQATAADLEARLGRLEAAAAAAMAAYSG
jgi:BMFP domain-containing protein YqiC